MLTGIENFNSKVTLFNSKGPEWVAGFADFRFETIPEGLPRIEPTKSHFPVAVFESVLKNCLAPFQDLLIKLKSTAEIPSITSIIGDEFGIPIVQFWTASACGFMGYFQYPELIKRGIFPFKVSGRGGNGRGSTAGQKL